MTRIDPQIVRQQIGNLLVSNPELAEDEVLRADMIEGETEAHEFLTRIVRTIEYARAFSDGVAERLKDLQARRDRFDRRIESFRNLAFQIMQAADLRRIELPEATLSIRNGTPKVVITDEFVLPALYFVVKSEPNKTAIKAALAAGDVVPGAELSNAEPSLSIRVK